MPARRARAHPCGMRPYLRQPPGQVRHPGSRMAADPNRLAPDAARRPQRPARGQSSLRAPDRSASEVAAKGGASADFWLVNNHDEKRVLACAANLKVYTVAMPDGRRGQPRISRYLRIPRVCCASGQPHPTRPPRPALTPPQPAWSNSLTRGRVQGAKTSSGQLLKRIRH